MVVIILFGRNAVCFLIIYFGRLKKWPAGWLWSTGCKRGSKELHELQYESPVLVVHPDNRQLSPVSKISKSGEKEE